MAGTFTGKLLGSGAGGAAATATIYTVPAGRTAYIKHMSAKIAAAGNVTFLVNNGSVDIEIEVVVMGAAGVAKFSPGGCIILEAGHALKTAVSVGNVSNYYASGVEET